MVKCSVETYNRGMASCSWPQGGREREQQYNGGGATSHLQLFSSSYDGFDATGHTENELSANRTQRRWPPIFAIASQPARYINVCMLQLYMLKKKCDQETDSLVTAGLTS